MSYESHLVAAALGFPHRALVKQIENLRGSLEALGELRSRVTAQPGAAVVRSFTINEKQFQFLASELANSGRVRSPAAELEYGAMPVDRLALRVMFYRGDEPPLLESRRWDTMETPPRRPDRPLDEIDYTGVRCGNMTALFWFRRKGVWVAKCDCGHYEFRKPAKWKRRLQEEAPDRCGVCLRRDQMRNGGSSNERVGERLFKWVATMRRLGLTDAEICLIRRIGTISVAGKTADEIRVEIAASARGL